MVDMNTAPDARALVEIVAAAPARDPEIAEREEFDAALAAGKPEALRLFIARHPESRWRREAELKLQEQQTPDKN